MTLVSHSEISQELLEELAVNFGTHIQQHQRANPRLLMIDVSSHATNSSIFSLVQSTIHENRPLK